MQVWGIYRGKKSAEKVADKLRDLGDKPRVVARSDGQYNVMTSKGISAISRAKKRR